MYWLSAGTAAGLWGHDSGRISEICFGVKENSKGRRMSDISEVMELVKITDIGAGLSRLLGLVNLSNT